MSTLARFTPSLMSAEQLERLFVARQPTLERVVRRIAEAESSMTRNHTLLVGPRGAGKTHLVALVAHRIRARIRDGAQLQLAWLAEDPWRITSYARLLFAITQALCKEGYAGPAGTAVQRFATAEDYEQQLVARAGERGPIVVVIENLDQVLGQIGRQGQQRLRHLLQDRRPLLLVATSTRLDRALSAQTAPLYGFFTTEHLEPFTVEQALEMLSRIAEESGDRELTEFMSSDTAKNRIKATAHLAGGQPRLWALFASGLTVAQIGDLVDMLLTRFDDLTPYYQERLARLAPQQRLVIAELADANGPLYVAQLAEKVGVTERSVGKTVSELQGLGWVREVRSPATALLDRRRTYYELAEPLARLAFQLKEAQGTPVRLVVEFIKAWFERRDLDRHTGGLAGRYINAAVRAIAGDPIGQLVRLLSGDGLPESRVPAVRFAGEVDDALAALIEGQAELYLSLPSAVRMVIDENLDSSRIAATASTERLRLQFELLGQLGFTDQKLAERWAKRGESLVGNGDSENEGLQLVNLGEAYTKAGQIQEARSAMDAAAARGMPLIAAEVACKIAAGLEANGKLSEAKALYEQALKAHAGPPIDADDSNHVLGIRNALASLRGELGDPAGAAADLRRVLDERLRRFGPDQHDTLATRQELAYWHAAAGQIDEAVVAYQELLADAIRAFGAQDRRTLATRGTLAYWQGEAGDLAEAVGTLEGLLEEDLRLLGPDHPDTFTTCNNLAMMHGYAGEPAKAVEQLQGLVADRERVLGVDHPETLAARGNLALWQGNAGDAAGAAKSYERLLADQTRLLGAEHPSVLTTRNNLAMMHGKIGNVAGASVEFERLLKDQLRTFGADHPDTLGTRNNLAMMHGEAGDVRRAIRELEELLRDQLRVLGAKHRAISVTRSNLEQWRMQARRR